ncbi:metal ABC transporter solute-binding protein, Zn/Mn family [uncultured Bifidobacterium sp.]|uniref:metal ABC transporter solute-binding protein, Zn/Mn family n=1 Tax=uncultured Bifidobacterium sp. TaxID=165187 RepID=UPI0025949C5D|nr:zinc ABC transporter substrate-binding protein [uncultured Bifidobacterium sp.]
MTSMSHPCVRVRYLGVLLTAAMSVASLAACTPAAPAADDGKLDVVASISQWGTMAQALGGDHVTVTSAIANAAADPHDYEPTTADIAGISAADIAVVNGAGYDAWACTAAETADVEVVDAGALAGVAEGDNPHLWFSSRVRTAVADALTAAYVAADPDHADDYARLNAQWEERERRLDDDIADIRESAASMPYAATESVAAYLFEDLGMEDVTPQGYLQAVSNEGEPGPADLRRFVDLLEAGEARLLVANSQHGDAAGGRLTDAAHAANVPVMQVGEQMPEGCDDVIAWMETLLGEIRDLLG